ncbi:hypothetical protein M2150_001693 [Lachnospiraceae bacterium PM6-15]|uniref:hypothetical protein n=1 Tax=Ohessyouella blattaphilus TaxID=2949333 RepID=UPI003E278604
MRGNDSLLQTIKGLRKENEKIRAMNEELIEYMKKEGIDVAQVLGNRDAVFEEWEVAVLKKKEFSDVEIEALSKDIKEPINPFYKHIFVAGSKDEIRENMKVYSENRGFFNDRKDRSFHHDECRSYIEVLKVITSEELDKVRDSAWVVTHEQYIEIKNHPMGIFDVICTKQEPIGDCWCAFNIRTGEEIENVSVDEAVNWCAKQRQANKKIQTRQVEKTR